MQTLESERVPNTLEGKHRRTYVDSLSTTLDDIEVVLRDCETSSKWQVGAILLALGSLSSCSLSWAMAQRFRKSKSPIWEHPLAGGAPQLLFQRLLVFGRLLKVPFQRLETYIISKIIGDQ